MRRERCGLPRDPDNASCRSAAGEPWALRPNSWSPRAFRVRRSRAAARRFATIARRSPCARRTLAARSRE